MGFGSYDESEQQNQEVNADDEDSEGVDIHEHEHEGEINFETDATTDELVDKLGDIKGTNSGE